MSDHSGLPPGVAEHQMYLDNLMRSLMNRPHSAPSFKDQPIPQYQKDYSPGASSGFDMSQDPRLINAPRELPLVTSGYNSQNMPRWSVQPPFREPAAGELKPAAIGNSPGYMGEQTPWDGPYGPSGWRI